MIKFSAFKKELHPDTTMADYISNLPARYNNSKAERIVAYLHHQFGGENCKSHPEHVVELRVESRIEEGDVVLYQHTSACCESYNQRIKDMIGKARTLFP